RAPLAAQWPSVSGGVYGGVSRGVQPCSQLKGEGANLPVSDSSRRGRSTPASRTGKEPPPRRRRARLGLARRRLPISRAARCRQGRTTDLLWSEDRRLS